MFDRDAVVASVDLAALADDLLGSRRGTARSPTWPCPNPNHAQTGRTPPVSVFTGRRGDQRWACHGCGAGGTAIDLVMATRGVGVHRALELLSGRADLAGPGAPSFPARLPVAAPPDPEALAALDAYVQECARRLWRPGGRAVRRWLTETRCLPADILAANRIGADPGPGLQPRPDGVPRRSGAVFPAMENGRAVYAQLRRLHPGPGQPRYLSVAGRLAPKPTLIRYYPAQPGPGPIVVTEGPTDALAAAAAGFETAAVLGTGGAGPSAAHALAHSQRPVVLAFDADDAGRAAAMRLESLLREQGCRVGLIGVPSDAGDVAGWMASSDNWRAAMRAAVGLATVGLGPPRDLVVG